MILPRRPDAESALSMVKLSTVRVLEFSSQTLRSGAVVLSDDAPPGSALLFLRGAPAVIRSIVKPASVPADFDQVGSRGQWGSGWVGRQPQQESLTASMGTILT